MTPEEARQKIIDKVLSLTSGWRLEMQEYIGNKVEKRYVHHSLPDGIQLIHEYFYRVKNLVSNISIRLFDQLIVCGGKDSILGVHYDAITQDIERQKQKEMDEKLIKIAESL